MDGVLDLMVAQALAPAQREAIAEWEQGADAYRAMLAALPRHRFRAIDAPLLAAAAGDVLEVGCGDGRLLARVGRAGVSSRMGIEPSQPLAAVAHARGIPVVRAVGERLPLPDRSVDTVLAGYYALRYADLDAALAEAARVLRPGGRLAFTLLGRRAVRLAARAAAIPLLGDPAHRWQAANLLLGRSDPATLPNDVGDLADLTQRLRQAGLQMAGALGTPYLPLLTAAASRLTAGRLPYLRGRAAALAFDVVVLARRR